MKYPYLKMSDEFLKKIDHYRSLIDEKLLSLGQKRKPAYLYDPINYIIQSKGKRIRPILVLLISELFGKKGDDVIPAALAVEFLHNFSLVHDDIMDNDDLRRGNPTVHKKWGESAAILTGDAIFVLAYDQIAQIKHRQEDCFKAFNEAAMKLCEGQALDKDFEKSDEITVNDYLKMVELKTGTLLSLCCQLGAIICDATDKENTSLKKFGNLIGQLFQIQDDSLEITSTSDVMGKSLGSDILEKKKTYLTCRALDNDAESWKNLMNAIYHLDVENEIIPKLKLFFEENGIMDDAKLKIRNLKDSAYKELDSFEKHKTKDIKSFLEFIVDRNR